MTTYVILKRQVGRDEHIATFHVRSERPAEKAMAYKNQLWPEKEYVLYVQVGGQNA